MDETNVITLGDPSKQKKTLAQAQAESEASVDRNNMINTTRLRDEVTNLMSDYEKWRKSPKGVNKAAFSNEMMEKYSYLYTSSKALFEKCLDGTMDFSKLDPMLAMIEKVKGGSSYFNASKNVGQMLTDIYVKPLIDKQ